MHATAQPWHAEGQPLPTGALRCLLSPRERPGTPPAARPGGCHGSSPVPPWQHAPSQDAPCAPARRWPAPAPSRRSEVLAACLESLQPPVLVGVAFVVQAPTGGIRSLCPDLINHQLPDRHWIPSGFIDRLAIKDQRIAGILPVVGDDQTRTHGHQAALLKTSLISPAQFGHTRPDTLPMHPILGTFWARPGGPIGEKSVGATGFEPAT